MVVMGRRATDAAGVTHDRVAVAVHEHRAGAADPAAATEFGTAELKSVAQHPQQRMSESTFTLCE